MKPYWTNGVVDMRHGDARDVLGWLPEQSIQACVTRPPYWGLRDYGIEPTVWDDGAGGAWLGTLGLEPTPELYVSHMVTVFRAVWRVLRDDGTLWLNLGDSYGAQQGKGFNTNVATGGTNRVTEMQAGHGDIRLNTGLKPKDLVGIPWRVAFALQTDGWYLRSDIIWSKPNPMPESVTDRPTKAHEYIFLLTKKPRYFYDADAIREATSPNTHWNDGNETWHAMPKQAKPGSGIKYNESFRKAIWGRVEARNKRTVWTVPTQGFGWEMCLSCGRIYTGVEFNRLPSVEFEVTDIETETTETKVAKQCRKCKSAEDWMSHYATFPEKLIEPCILAGSASKTCAECGSPWERVAERKSWTTRPNSDGIRGHSPSANRSISGPQRGARMSSSKTTGFRPTCDHESGTVPGTVLDLFGGSGTVGLVAQKHGRRAILIDVNEKYLAMAQRRIESVPLPLGV